MAAKAGKKRPKKARKAKQQWLDPEMAPPSIPEIDRAADDYVDARDTRMSALEEEVELQGKLRELMTKHSLTSYEYDERIVTLNGEPKVKVAKKPKEKVEAD